MVEKITSFQNPRLKLIKKLREKKDRERERRFVIDDGRDLERALACGYEVDFALVAPDLTTDAQALPAGVDEDQVYEVNREMLEKASYRTNPGALVAVMHAKPVPGVADLAQIAGQPILGLVNLQKPGNIGALLRTADAAGYPAVLLIDTVLDRYNPNLIRSSTGACFLDIVYAVSSAEARAFFREYDYQVLAAHLAGSRSLFETDIATRSAILLGTEDVGLDATWAEAADVLVRIPMPGKISDSLNVSVSGAVLMYEALRQRWQREGEPRNGWREQ